MIAFGEEGDCITVYGPSKVVARSYDYDGNRFGVELDNSGFLEAFKLLKLQAMSKLEVEMILHMILPKFAILLVIIATLIIIHIHYMRTWDSDYQIAECFSHRLSSSN
jgi:hypothetical protein